MLSTFGRVGASLFLGFSLMMGSAVADPARSDFKKDLQFINEMVSKVTLHVKQTTNVNSTNTDFDMAVASGQRNIYWSAKAVAMRKRNVAIHWLRALELNTDALWNANIADANVCGPACAQSFLNVLFTFSNAMFFLNDYAMYEMWIYNQANMLSPREIVEGSDRVIKTELGEANRLGRILALWIRRVELSPIIQHGLAAYAAIPRLPLPFPYVAGAPLFPQVYQYGYFGQIYFPFYDGVPGRYFVPQMMMPRIAQMGYQQMLPRGYGQGGFMAADQYYGEDYGVVAGGGNLASAPGAIGEGYVGDAEWRGGMQGVDPQSMAQPRTQYTDYYRQGYGRNMQQYQNQGLLGQEIDYDREQGLGQGANVGPNGGRGQAGDPRLGGQGYDPRTGGQGYDQRGGGQGYDPRAGGQGYDPRGGGQGYDQRGGGQGYNPRAGGQGYDPRYGRQGYDQRMDPRGQQGYGNRPGTRDYRPAQVVPQDGSGQPAGNGLQPGVDNGSVPNRAPRSGTPAAGNEWEL